MSDAVKLQSPVATLSQQGSKVEPGRLGPASWHGSCMRRDVSTRRRSAAVTLRSSRTRTTLRRRRSGEPCRPNSAQKGNRDAALILIGEAVDLFRRTDSVVAQAETLVDLAGVLRLAGRRKEADDVLEGAVELFEAKGNVAAVEALRVPAASS